MGALCRWSSAGYWICLLYGVAYGSDVHNDNVFSRTNSGGREFTKNPAPCAVCDVPGRSRTAMIPARTQCPDDWTKQYAGYVVSERGDVDRKRSSYVCFDEVPEIAVGDSSQWQSEFHHVEVHCGTLPCSVYISGRELTCVVCSI